MKAFDVSPSSCRFRTALTAKAAGVTEGIFNARYFDKRMRWTTNGTTIHKSDPRYYYTSPASRVSGSGTGSDLGNATSASLAFLAQVISDFQIETMVDAPCGDANWQFGAWEVDSLKAYVGLDLVRDVVQLDARRYAFHSNKRFLHWDLSRCPLPRIRWNASSSPAARAAPLSWAPPDLVHMRDVLQHLRYSTGMRVLRRVFESGAGYLVGTTFPSADMVGKGAGRAGAAGEQQAGQQEGQQAGPKSQRKNLEGHAGHDTKTTNRAILDGNFFLADLQRPPFSLPTPLRCVRTHPALEPDLTCLWRIDAATRDAWLQRHGAKISMPKVIGDAEDGVSMVRVGGTAAA